MKICVLGLDCAAPDIIFQDERLGNIRRLMSMGVYGRLESVVPPITVPAWMCMATSQDPGSLGVYGFRNRKDFSYNGLGFVNSSTIKELAIWDQFTREGREAVLIGVPPNFPPRRIHGVSVGCFLTPDPATSDYTHPPEIKAKIHELVGDYAVDVKGFRTDRKDWLKQEVFEMSRKQWQVVRWLLTERKWEYFQFVDIGLDRIHHAFWQYFDNQHINHEPGNPYQDVIPEYYRWLDEQIGSVLEILDNDTILLLVSDHGAQRLDGGFAVNEWLVNQGLLVLDEYPTEVTPFNKLKVNWSKTKVWSDGGYYARVFFNIKGREPQGTIPATEYAAFQEEMKRRFEELTDDRGRPLESLVFKPGEIYLNTRNVPPDLIVHFGGLYWRSIGGVGYGSVHVQENDSGPDACNHAQYGMFLLSSANCPLQGQYHGAKLLDIAPTLLDLAGMDIPASMQGRSLVAGKEKKPPAVTLEKDERIIHNRLAGLGYV